MAEYRKVTGVDFVKALDKAGFPDVAQNIYNMLRQKVAGDYLHTASIFDEHFHVYSGVKISRSTLSWGWWMMVSC